MIPWHSTPRLTLDVEGVAWLWRDPGYDRLGPIASAEVAEDLAAELAECRDLWGDAFDSKREQEWHYRSRA